MDEFIPYEQASNLKTLGFNEPSIAYYTFATERLSKTHSMVPGNVNFEVVTLENIYKDYCLAPTYRKTFKWLRDKHDLHGEFYFNHSGCGFIATKTNGTTLYEITDDTFFETLEEAELACLKKLIEIIKK